MTRDLAGSPVAKGIVEVNVRRLGRLLALVITVAVAAFSLVALGACKSACAAGPGTLRTEDDTTTWQEWLKQGQKQQAGPKKPKNNDGDGGVNPKGGSGGGVSAKACKGGSSGKTGSKSGKDSSIFGANGTQIIPARNLIDNQRVGKTRYRIDVENPAPGKRPGSLHVQLDGKGTTQYHWRPGDNFYSKDGDALPRKIQEHIDNSEAAQRAVRQGLQYLGEK